MFEYSTSHSRNGHCQELVPGPGGRCFAKGRLEATGFGAMWFGGRRAGELEVIVLMDNANILPGDSENIHFDIAAIVVLVADSPIEDEFVWTMRNVGIDHVLLGSDYPQYSLGQNLSALDRLDFDESEKAKIRYEYARALLGRCR